MSEAIPMCVMCGDREVQIVVNSAGSGYCSPECDASDREALTAHEGEGLLGDSPKSPLGDITTIGQLFEIIDWDFDGAGLTVTDGEALANAIADRFPHLINDMPHFVKEIA
jgi:hypothetical protein